MTEPLADFVIESSFNKVQSFTMYGSDRVCDEDYIK